MPVALIQVFVAVAELAAKYGPGLLRVGENLIDAIKSHGELTDAERASLIERVAATRAAVQAYEPRPSPPDPDLTPR